jgi:hypothetical protein
MKFVLFFKIIWHILAILSRTEYNWQPSSNYVTLRRCLARQLNLFFVKIIFFSYNFFIFLGCFDVHLYNKKYIYIIWCISSEIFASIAGRVLYCKVHIMFYRSLYLAKILWWKTKFIPKKNISAIKVGIQPSTEHRTKEIELSANSRKEALSHQRPDDKHSDFSTRTKSSSPSLLPRAFVLPWYLKMHLIFPW